MIGYLFYDAAGEIRSYMKCSPEEAQINADTLGLSFIESESAHPALYFVSDGQVMEKPAAGPVEVEHQELAEPTLLEVQNRRWEAIKAQRDYFEHAGFDTPFGRFDSDAASQTKLIGASVAASVAPEEWVIEWTLQDNTIVVLTGQEVVQVAQTLLLHINSTHQQGRLLREQIYAEDATIESVNTVVWVSQASVNTSSEDEGELDGLVQDGDGGSLE
jgi:hypothetical protein